MHPIIWTFFICKNASSWQNVLVTEYEMRRMLMDGMRRTWNTLQNKSKHQILHLIFSNKNKFFKYIQSTWETLRIWTKDKYEKNKFFPFFIYYICAAVHFFKNTFFHKIWIFLSRELSKVGFLFFSENSKKIQKKPCEKTKKMSKNLPPPKKKKKNMTFFKKKSFSKLFKINFF